MVNVKLNNEIFENVKDVKLNTVDGNEVLFILEDDAKRREASIIEETFDGEFKNDLVTYIGESKFAYSSVTKVDCPNVTDIAEKGFYECRDLETINMPKVRWVGHQGLANCSLTILDFPLLKGFCNTSFYWNESLHTLILRHDSIPSKYQYCEDNYMGNLNNWLWQTPISFGNGFIYVPRALVEDYKNTSFFNQYATQYCALEDFTVDGTITGALDPNKVANNQGSAGLYEKDTNNLIKSWNESLNNYNLKINDNHGDDYRRYLDIKNIHIDPIAVDGDFVIQSGIQGLGEASLGWTVFDSVLIPVTIEKISRRTFSNRLELPIVKYGGTMEDWQKIIREDRWYPGTEVTIHCIDGDIIEDPSIGYNV